MGHGNLRFPVRPPPFYDLGGLRPPPLRGLPLLWGASRPGRGYAAPSVKLFLALLATDNLFIICETKGVSEYL